MFPNYEYRSRTYSIIDFKKFINCEPRFHKHVEIGYVTEGTLNVMIENTVWHLSKGDIYIVFPNLIHSITDANAQGVVAIADPSFIDAYYEKLIGHRPIKPILTKDNVLNHLEVLFNRLRDFSGNKCDENSQRIIGGYINVIIGEILLNLPTAQRSFDSSLVQNIMMYLLNNYTDDITLDSLANSLCYSKWYISKVIFSTFDCNFRTLVNSYRIEMAKNLLLSTRKSITEIAQECGFKNQSSFNRVFLTVEKLTPSKFRRNKTSPLNKPDIYYAK